MILDEIESNAHYRLKSILKILREYCDVKIDFNNDAKLVEMYKEYSSFRKNNLNESLISSYNSDKILVANLICEAIKIYLKEIRPKRSYINSIEDKSGVEHE